MDIDLLWFSREVIFSKSRFLGFFGGRRLGKTETWKRFFITKALSEPGYRQMYLTPVASQGDDAFEGLMQYPELDEYVLKTKTRPCRMWLKNGSYLGMNSFQRSSNIRGRYFNSVWTDESQDIDGVALLRVCRPMLSDLRGASIVSGQLPSKGHWSYRDYYAPGQAPPGSAENPLDNGIPRYKSWAIPSSEGPVFWGEAGAKELAIARSQMPKWMFDSEYLCRPTGAQNCIFTPESLERVTRGAVPSLGYHSGKFIIAHDIGRIVDPGATVVMHESGLVVYAENMPIRETHAAQARRLLMLSARYGDALVVLDATGGGGGGHTSQQDEVIKIYNGLLTHSRNIFLTRQTKPEIVTALSVAIEQEKLSIPAAHGQLLEQLAEYQATYQGGYWSYSSPKGSHDDLVMALAMAYWGKLKGWLLV